jgi:hypothetical protein
MMEVKRGRGRPKGSKDQKKRLPRRTYVPVQEILEQPSLTVIQKLRMLKYPQRLKVYAEITGLSVALLRKKVEQGKIRAFHRSGNLLVEPLDFENYWSGGLR